MYLSNSMYLSKGNQSIFEVINEVINEVNNPLSLH